MAREKYIFATNKLFCALLSENNFGKHLPEAMAAVIATFLRSWFCNGCNGRFAMVDVAMELH